MPRRTDTMASFRRIRYSFQAVILVSVAHFSFSVRACVCLVVRVVSVVERHTRKVSGKVSGGTGMFAYPSWARRGNH